jgi:hypothetical protein
LAEGADAGEACRLTQGGALGAEPITVFAPAAALLKDVPDRRHVDGYALLGVVAVVVAADRRSSRPKKADGVVGIVQILRVLVLSDEHGAFKGYLYAHCALALRGNYDDGCNHAHRHMTILTNELIFAHIYGGSHNKKTAAASRKSMMQRSSLSGVHF